ncbi:MAG: RMD1 family protein [Hyphomicrobiaceae bacterium]|nr:RMD1 family protein [Hyphomicrobiaceae bacterium]
MPPAHQATQPLASVTVRAIQLCETLDLKGLEREDVFSKSPLAFAAGHNGVAVLFKFGAAAFIGMTPVEEDDLIRGLGERIVGPLDNREVETAQIAANADDDSVTPQGLIQIKTRDTPRLLLIAEALAVSVALAHDERRVARAFERIAPIGNSLVARKLPGGSHAAMLEEIGEALLVQQRLAGRVDLDDKPDVLWDKPELERFWAKLVDEYDLAARARAIERKLSAIQETTQTITDLVATRTSHRLEWYIIGLITLEIVLSFYDRFKVLK